jgi:hypothetical protein
LEALAQQLHRDSSRLSSNAARAIPTAFLGAFPAGAINIALTDTAIRTAKARECNYKLGDGGGLYLLVTRSGGRLSRLKYRADGVERKLSIGKYPAISLSDVEAGRHPLAIAP